MAACPAKAIVVGTLSYEKDFIETSASDGWSFIDFQRLLSTRRSVRVFRDQPVPDEVFQKIVEAVRCAPYGVAPDNVSMTVVRTREVIDKALPLISGLYRNLGKALANPVARVLLRRMLSAESYNAVVNHLLPMIKVGQYELRPGDDRITRGAPAFILFHAEKYSEEHTIDCHIALTYAFLAAHAMGMGATVIGLLPPAVNRNAELKKLFKIPETHEVVASMILGYPKVRFKREIRRKVRTLELV
jgi:nitroreductase